MSLPKKQSGFAMVIVIWVLSLLTIMAASFALSMRRETTVISAVKDNAVMQAYAEAGLGMAQQMLSLTDNNSRWRADGSIYPLRYQDVDIRVRVFSEQGKIDINKADEQLLTELISSLPIELDAQQALVSAILDWRDQDDLVHLNGAEKDEYEQAGLSYHPANKNFQLIDELKLVLGMSKESYQQLKGLITVYSKQPKVNLKLASKEVLEVVGKLDTETMDEYLLQRKENNLAAIPAPAFPLAMSETSQNAGGEQVYTIISQAQIADQQSAGIKVILQKTNNSDLDTPFQILDWQTLQMKESLFEQGMRQLLVFQDEPEHRN